MVPPREHLEMPGDILVVTTGGGANSILWAKARDVATTLQFTGQPPLQAKNCPAPNVNS